MYIFNAISLLGGLALFLYGMRLMSSNLKEGSSGTLKVVMEKVTNNPLKAFILGVAITAIIQSSTATIVITSGLVAAGIISLRQSLGIIIGANVGTTVTGQIIRLLDVNADGNFWLRFFQPVTLAPLALIIGISLIMFFKFNKSDNLGNIAIGFGVLFTGLLNMTAAVSEFSENGMLGRVFYSLGDNPWLGYLAGAGVAFVLQSSSATIGILQAFSMARGIPFRTIYVIIVGVYLGDCVTTAIVCSIGAKPDARRVGIINILYNLSKTLAVVVVVFILHKIGLLGSLWDRELTSGGIANTNSIFNLICAVALLPVTGTFERLSKKIVKDEA
ncbi:MAG: Na/Pi cotransporter family protein, partial [Lachnospiraceae bacterium]|nr:Na/Pi cotransporter family protein [Lachnospiraceae bacterium]